jgi:hypothetical protein
MQMAIEVDEWRSRLIDSKFGRERRAREREREREARSRF